MEHVVQTIETVEARMRDDQKLINALCRLASLELRYPTAELPMVHRLALAPAAPPAPARKGKWGGARKKKEPEGKAQRDASPARETRAIPAAAPEGESLPDAQRRIVNAIAEPFTVEDILQQLSAALKTDEAAAKKKLSANCSYWRSTGKLVWASNAVGSGPVSYNRTKDWALA